MKPAPSKRRVAWVRLGVLGLASLHCGTPSVGEPPAELPTTSDAIVPATSPLPLPAPIAPNGATNTEGGSMPHVGGQTGDDSGSVALACDLVTESRIALDDARLGFSANQRLAVVRGARETTLRWLEPVYDASGTLLDHATRETGSANVEIEVLSDEATLLERRDSLYDVECQPRLLGEARLTVSSADGALAESVDGVLELGSSTGLVYLTASLPVTALRGSYTFEPPELDGRAPGALLFSTTFSRYGQTGAIVQQYGKGADATALWSAQWPDWHPCDPRAPIPVTYPEQRPSVSDLLEDVRRHAPVVILGPGGERTPAQLELEAVPNSACHRLDLDAVSQASTDTVSVQTQLTLTSDVLPGAVHLPLELSTSFSADSPDRYGYFNPTPTCASTARYTPQDFATHCGDWGIDTSGVDSVFLELESQITPASGYVLFRVRGMRYPGCTPGDRGFDCTEDAADRQPEVVDLREVRVLLGTP